MKSLRFYTLVLMAIALLLLGACTPGLASLTGTVNSQPQAQILGTAVAGTPAPAATQAAPARSTAAPNSGTIANPTSVPSAASTAGRAVAGDLQSLLQQVYQTANASVVHIVVTEGSTTGPNLQIPGNPTPSVPRNNPNFSIPQQAEGSGFVWDKQGNIVTNNHVVEGSTDIAVTFSDGATVPASIVGTDPDSDLAVIKVDTKGLDLRPVAVGDSTQAFPGQFVVAIGNPFGLDGSMTFGIISAIGRSIAAGSSQTLTTPNYTIPDIIQTDAPINPGNSGGVLLDLQGRLLGVPSAIESSTRSNSGVGFAIPSAIVQKIVPALIQNGKAQHPYIGFSGTTLGPDLAQAMNLDASQRGALVISVTPGTPAEQAGLRGGNKQVTVAGIPTNVGGDLIVKIDNQPVKRFEDLTSYLARSTNVGQTVTLTVLRDGKETNLQVKLGDRPSQTGAAAAATPRAGGRAVPATPQAPRSTPQAPQSTPQASTRPWLGVEILNLTPEIAKAMNLSDTQTGALVQNVTAGSPAEKAGVQGSTKAFTTADGQAIKVGGDVVTAVDGQAVRSDQDLINQIGNHRPGDKITLTVLRNGSTTDLSVTLGTRP